MLSPTCLLGQGAAPGLRHPAHARAAGDHRARAEPAAEACAWRHRGDRRRQAGRRRYRGGLHRSGPVHPAEPRHVERAADLASRGRPRAGVRLAAGGTAQARAGGRQRWCVRGNPHPHRGTAGDDLLPRRRRGRPAAGRYRARDQRRCGRPGQAVARRGHGPARHRYRARPSGQDGLRYQGRQVGEHRWCR